MSDATCKTCRWWNLRNAYGVARAIGECRFHAPVIHEGPPWPSTDDTDWCGSHPDRQPHLECAMTTLVTHDDDGPSAADMRRIVDALEKMASRAQRATP